MAMLMPYREAVLQLQMTICSQRRGGNVRIDIKLLVSGVCVISDVCVLSY